HIVIDEAVPKDGKVMSVQPAEQIGLIKKVQTSPYQAEGLVKFHLVDEKMFIGVGYRTDWLLTTMFGFKANRLHFIYSADFMPVQRSAAQVYGASHEFTVGIDLNDNWKQFYEGE
ncbi:MAG: type IX secretion system membrane protein PorP/SprF, partial [Bacteroidota bacterium]